MYVFTQLPWEGSDTRSIFKCSTASLNSEFSFFKTVCFTKAEGLGPTYYLLIARGWIRAFPKEMKHKYACPGFELRLLIPFTTMININALQMYIIL